MKRSSSLIDYKITLPAWSNRYGLLICITIGLFLRLFLSIEADYWLDELWGAGFSNPKNSLELVISKTVSDVHPPLYQILLYYWFSLFGFSEISGRLLSLIFGFIAIPAFFFLARKIYNQEIAKIALIFFVFNPFAIFYSAETRSYELLLLLSILSTYFFVVIIKENSRRAYFLYYLTSLMMVYTHYFGVITLLTHSLIIALITLRNKDSKTFIFVATIYILLFLSYLPMLDAVISNLERDTFSIKHHSFLFLLAYIPLFFGGLYSIPFMLLTAFIFFKNHSQLKYREYLILLSVIIMLLVPYSVGFFMNPIMRPRNVIIAVPLLIMLISYLVERSGSKYIFASVLLSLLTAISSTAYIASTKGANMDPLFRSALRNGQTIYMLTHKWRTSRFVFTKVDMNKDKYPGLQIRDLSELRDSKPSSYWIACYFSCSSTEIFNDVIPDGYQIVQKMSERSIEAVLIENPHFSFEN